jgi:gliding motility-associated-like protein
MRNFTTYIKTTVFAALVMMSSYAASGQAVCGEAFRNGGFESGSLTSWTVASASPAPFAAGGAGHTGSFSAFLGSPNGGETPGDCSIYQTIQVPAAGGTLSFWYYPTTTDDITFDWQDAYVLDQSGTLLATIMHVCSNAQTWTNVTYSMNAYAGQTVRIMFLVHGDNFGDWTNMYLDDVSMTIPLAPTSFTQSPVICQGQSLTVNGNVYSSAGSYLDTLVGANSTGCDSIVTTNLTVSTLPSAPTISANPSTICAGSTATLTSVSPGGGADSLATSFAATIVAAGNMFDVTVARNIVLTSFDVNSNTTAGSVHSFAVYYKSGTATGFTTTSAAWTLLATVNATSAGLNGPSRVALPAALVLSGGQTYAFYITATDGSNLAYFNPGTAVGNVAASNASLSILDGYASNYPFAGTFQTRRWNGRIQYYLPGETRWYLVPSGGAAFAAGTPVTVTPANTITYYAELVDTSTAAACASATRSSVTVTVNQPSSGSQSVYICQGQTYTLNGHTYSSAGTYIDTLVGTNSVACDSIVTTNLTINPLPADPAITASATTICNGDSTVLSTGGAVSLTTLFGGGNSFNGNMFDVNAFKTLAITSFDVNIDFGTHPVQVYYKTGTATGFDQTPGAWTLFASVSANSAGANTATPVVLPSGLTLSAGQLYAFYITTTDGSSMYYTNGSGVGNVYAANGDLNILQGYGKQYPFGSTFSPRVWNGTIHYQTTTTNWYTVATLGSPFASGASVTVFPTNTTTYYAESVDSITGCISANRGSIAITVNQPSSASQSVYICQGQTYTLNGHTYSSDGTYIDTLVGANSVACDSIVTTNLTVNPIPGFDPSPSSLTVCNGDAASAHYSGTVTGETFDWTGTDATIGIATSGNGDIASFTATNAGTAPVIDTITVTPSYTNGGTTCTGTPQVFTLTVNPTPIANPTSDQAVCNNGATAAVAFTGAVTGTVYDWTSSDGTIGLATSGTGDIASFTAINSGTTPVVDMIIVTPSYTHAGTTCTGIADTFYITVNPTPADPAITASATTICNGDSTVLSTGGAVSLTTLFGGGNSFNGNMFDVNAFKTLAITSFDVNIDFGTHPVQVYYKTGTATGFDQTPGAWTLFASVSANSAGANTATPVVLPSGLTLSAGQLYAFYITTTDGSSMYYTNGSGVGNVYAANGDLNILQGYGKQYPFGSTFSPRVWNGTIHYQTTTTNWYTVATLGSPFASGASVTVFPTNTTTYYAESVDSITGCISANRGSIAITVNQPSSASQSVYICQGQTYTLNGHTYSSDGTYIDTLVGANSVACDSIVTTNLTVNPIPGFDPSPSSLTVCNGDAASAHYSGTVTGETFDWTGTDATIGIATSGNGDIASFTATNAGTAPVIDTITVTPSYTNGGTTCTGTPAIFTITVNPIPTVNPSSDQVVCNNGATTTVTFTGAVTGTVYDWTSSDGTISLATSGTGDIASFTATNSGTTPVVDMIIVTPSYTNGGTTCTGTADTFYITVNPTPTVNPSSDQVVCNNGATTTVTFTGAVTGTVYDWTSSDGTIGLATSGTGDIASFTATNSGTTPVVDMIIVTPSYTNGGTTCTGTSDTFFITVNPTPTVNPSSDQVVCNNGATTNVAFTGAVVGTVYDWTGTDGTIGIASSGTGDIASFTATNAGTTTLVDTIIVTPSYTNAGVTCTGTSDTFFITVNPTPTVNPTSDQVVCNNGATTAVAFTGAVTGTVYDWTSSDGTIGLATSGTGDIASFTAANSGTAPVIDMIIVTPSYTNAGTTCTGAADTFYITVNPTPTVNPSSDQVVCNNGATAAVAFTGAVTGTVYDWTSSDGTIGLATSGTGDIASFTATNSGTTPVVDTIIVTPSYTNAGVTCTGTPDTFFITVNPTPTVNPSADQVVCHQDLTTAVSFSGAVAGTVYDWTNSDATIGLSASGTGDIAAFTALNFSTSAKVATIIVTPSYTNGGTTCTGTPDTFTITINPRPLFDPPASDIVVCNNSTTSVNFYTSVPGTVVTWTGTDGTIGLAPSGTGDIAPFTATNLGNVPAIDTIFVATSYTNAGVTCAGESDTFTITVNPTPNVDPTGDQVVCNNNAINAITFTGTVSGTVYNWTGTDGTIGLATSGTGDIASFVVSNTTAFPVTDTIIVTPSYTNAGVTCTGASDTFFITVNPTPNVIPTADQVLCNGFATGTVAFGGKVAGTVYDWTGTDGTIGLATSGTGDIASFTATNSGNVPVIDTIVVTPSYTNGGVTCTGPSDTFTITVNPTPIITPTADQQVCNGDTTNTLSFTSTVVGTTFDWVSTNGTIGLATSGSGNVPSFTAINPTTSDLIDSVIVTPTSPDGCVGVADTFTITIHPTPVVTLGANVTTCGGSVQIDAGNAGSSYVWSDGATTQIDTVSTSGIYTVTVTTIYGCIDSAHKTIYVKPAPSVNIGSDATYCGGSATLDAGNVGATYLWSNGATTQQITVSATNDYSVIVTDTASSCQGFDTVHLVFNTQPVVNLGPDTTLCGGSLTLTAGDPSNTYLWSPSGSTSNTITVTTSGTYTVTVNYPNGCSAVGSINVTVFIKPNLGADVTDSICPGSTANLYNYYQGSGLTLTYNTATPGAVDSGTYTVIGTNANGCSDTATISIIYRTKPDLKFDKTDSVCPGYTYNLDNLYPHTGYTTYTWTGTFTETAVGPGTYTLIVTNASGCSDTAVATIINSQRPTLGGNKTDSICQHYTYDLTTLYPNTYATYTWTNVADPTAVVAGTYQLVVSNAAGCTDTVYATITYRQQPVVTLSVSPNLCSTVPAFQLTGGSPAGGTYFVNNVPTSTFDPSLLGAGVQSVVYVYTNASGCTDSAVTTITIFPQPNITNTTLPVLCTNSQAIDLSQYFNPDGGSFFGPGVSGQYFYPTLTSAGPDSITYIYTDSHGCRDTGGTTIIVTNNVHVSLHTNSSNFTICQGQPVTFFAEGATNYQFFVNGVAATSISDTATFTTTTLANHDQVTVVGSNVCSSDTSDFIIIDVNQSPVADAGRDTTIELGQTAQLNGSGTGGTGNLTYSWTPTAYLNFPNVPNPKYNGMDTVLFVLTVTDANGCFDTASVTVNVHIPDNIQLPNILTPNGDGQNDAWILNSKINLAGSHLVVFNRWGEKVYETTDYNNDWKGTYMTSNDKLPDGTYYYVLKVPAQNNYEYKGPINLLSTQK